MLWLKWLHICSVITWFAALFYLPRLFVYHAMAEDSTSVDRFQIMERKLYRGIATPSMVVVLASGLALWAWGYSGGWVYLKVLLVAVLVVYHFWAAHTMRRFAKQQNRHSHVYYRWMNEIPAVLLLAIVHLVVFKPF